MAKSLINKSAVKTLALDIASGRFHKFTRVGSEFYTEIEGVVKDYIKRKISELPSKGKTIK